MRRLPDPEQLYLSTRLRLSARLVHEGGMTLDRAQDWIALWESEARSRFLGRRTPAWWDDAWAWIAEQRDRP